MRVDSLGFTDAAVVLAAAAGTLMLAACGEPAALGRPQAAPTAVAPHGASGESIDQASAQFKAQALNALLIPLLDDDVPPRWADPMIAMSCAALRVMVDGVAPVPHEAVPAVPFVVRWQLDHCAPLGAGMLLSGEVELLVYHDGDSYSAHVQPDDLRVTTLLDSFSLDRPFAASTPLLAPR